MEGAGAHCSARCLARYHVQAASCRAMSSAQSERNEACGATASLATTRSLATEMSAKVC